MASQESLSLGHPNRSCTTTKVDKRLEIADLGRRGIVLPMYRKQRHKLAI